jgi:soluble lytic murein transglycosylase-like protein
MMRPGKRAGAHRHAGAMVLNRRTLRFGLAFVLAAAGISTPASAQIYTWRDASGTLVLSDRPLSANARSFPVPRVQGIRATKPPLSGSPTSFEPLIQEHASRQGVRPDLVRAVIQVESGFNPRAVSSKGAKGLMQLMPATARQFGVRDVFDPAENIRAGVGYLRTLLDRYNSEALALAAYNAGPGAVDRHDSQIPPYPETVAYVRRIRAVTTLGVGPGRAIYKSIEIVDGRPVPRYSDTKPANGAYEVLGGRD